MMDLHIDDLGGYGTHAADLLGYYDFYIGPLPRNAIAVALQHANASGNSNLMIAGFRAAEANGPLHLPLKDGGGQMLRNERGIFSFAFTDPEAAAKHAQENGADTVAVATLAQVLGLHEEGAQAFGEEWQGFILDNAAIIFPALAERALAHPAGPMKDAPPPPVQA